MKLEKLKTKANLALPAACDAYQAAPLKAELLAAIKHGKPLTIKASEVTQADTQFLQVLAAGKTAFDTSEIKFELADISPTLQRALICTGLFSFFNASETEDK